MNIRKSSIFLFPSVCMIILILDSKTAMLGAAEGTNICIRSLIPSLFPFFIFSTILTSSLSGQAIRMFRPLNRLCRIPLCSESLLCIGLISGYPVGAQNVIFAWKTGCLTTEDAQRMMVFCNNAGPAFIFGFLGQLFHQPYLPWILWLIHIASAVLTGFLLPGGSEKQVQITNSAQISLPDALDTSIRVMARVCGWVVLFRIFLEFLRNWVFWRLPVAIQIFFTGFLELSNGCLMLQNLSSDGLRLIFASTFLGFGGLCVLLQTHSIARALPFSSYLPGKLLQGSISFLLSYGVQFLLMPHDRVHFSPYIPGIVLIAAFSILYLRKLKKPVAISEKMLYNEKSSEKRRILCCFEKKSSVPAPTAFTAPN